MSGRYLAWFFGAVLGIGALAGCGSAERASDQEGNNHDAAAVRPVSFKEGLGLHFAPQTSAALGLKTAEVGERTVQPSYELTAFVFDAGPPARASSLVPRETAEDLEQHPPAEAKIIAIQRETVSALTQVELILALPGKPAVGTTTGLSLHGRARAGIVVPRTSVLRSANGTFVYVVNGDHLLRTAVKLGAVDRDYLEIIDGLYAGDVVAITAVEQLWLTELRLTKGGGHSH